MCRNHEAVLKKAYADAKDCLAHGGDPMKEAGSCLAKIEELFSLIDYNLARLSAVQDAKPEIAAPVFTRVCQRTGKLKELVKYAKAQSQG